MITAFGSDPGEARTLDPMIKSHLLYQLSYGVNRLSISVAKVRNIFELASVFANFFEEKCFFCVFQSCQVGLWRNVTKSFVPVPLEELC